MASRDRGRTYDSFAYDIAGLQAVGTEQRVLSKRFGSENFKICSDYLFAMDQETGEKAWKYDGLIINSAIAVGSDSVYFVENRNSRLVDNIHYFERRIGDEELWKNLYLVALDARTGQKQWEKSIDFIKEGTFVFYLCHANGTVVIVSSSIMELQSYLYAFNASDGAVLWDKSSP